PDLPLWYYSANGQYTTSSGYSQALRRRPKKKTPPSLALPTDPVLWRSIWDLRIQPKLRFFLWRISHRILPILEGLNSRGVSLPMQCPCCLLETETIEHLLFKCIVARRLFRISNLNLDSVPHTHPTITWRIIFSTRPLEAPLWVLAWWRVWKSRNWVVFDKFQSATSALHRQLTFDIDSLAFLPCVAPPPPPPPIPSSPSSPSPMLVPSQISKNKN
ncbi:hypothetical protein LINPERHAP2_LOCUS8325, partial [Linum perenne]